MITKMEGALGETEYFNISDSFFSTSWDLLCVAGLDGFFKQVNPAWTRTLGWSSSDLTTKPYLDFVHPEDLDRTQQAAQRLESREIVVEFKNRYRCKDGTYRFLEWTARTDSALPLIYAAARDKTVHHQRMRAEREAASLALLVNTIHDPVYVISPRQGFRFIYVNDAASRHFGYPRERLLEMCISDWDDTFPPEKCEAFWAQLIEAQTLIFETEHRLSNGSKIPAEVTASHIFFNGEACIAGFIRDTRERKRVESELRGYADQVERTNAELEQFAYVASHDLQEPLRTISSYLRLLERRNVGRLSAESHEFLNFALDGAGRLRELIRDLLAYSHIGASGLPREEVDVQEIVGITLAQLQQAIGDSGATLTVDRLPKVRANRVALIAVFQNLIENAIKYRSERPVQIQISAERLLGEWSFSVKDNGIGIAEKDTARIFGRFQRLHARTDYQGTGIGLATCKKVVELLGGKIRVASTPGVGSEFIFRLPV